MNKTSSSIVMPKLGLTMTEGILERWNIEVGSKVSTGDILFSVETDKTVMEIEARADGEVLSLEVEEGQLVDVGVTVATWTGPPTAADLSLEQEPRESIEEEVVTKGQDRKLGGKIARSDRVKASPSARKLALELGLDIKKIAASHLSGRVGLKDVEAYMKKKNQESETRGNHPLETGESRKANSFQKIVAGRVVQSKRDIPHFYVLADADVSELLQLRSKINKDLAHDTRLSVNDFIVVAVARALGDFADLNSIWEEGEITTFSNVDIGVVVNTERGLYVPVLKNLLGKDIYEVSRIISDMAARANSGQLTLEDMKGGAISVSNVGMYGAVTLLPIINVGQSAVLGVGAPSDIFKPDESGNPILRRELKLALACDHRIYDGVKATQLLGRILEILAEPSLLLSD